LVELRNSAAARLGGRENLAAARRNAFGSCGSSVACDL
jgi:hypothetical protein